MPRKSLMSWDRHNKQWRKLFKGRRYVVTCTELEAPPTELGSQAAANAWWENKLAELAPTYAVRDFSPEGRNRLLQSLISGPAKNELQAWADESRRIAALLESGVPLKHLELERVTSFTGGTVATAQTIGEHVSEFLAMVRGTVKPMSYAEIANYLELLIAQEFMPADADVTTIDVKTVTAHYLWLKSKDDWAGKTKAKRLGIFRRFVTYLIEHDVIDTPKNLRSRSHKFAKTKKAVRVFADVWQTIKDLPDDYRLWALLGINCSMTQADLGALDWNWIDTKNWILTRCRVKLETRSENPPVTRYKLWPEVVALLSKRTNRTGLVFQTRDGVPMYVTMIDGKTGVTSKKDLFAVYWNRYDVTTGKQTPRKKRNEHPIAISLGKFRSIGATAIKSDIRYRGLVEYYLANTPQSIADQHYGAETDAVFFEALEYVRRQVLKPTA